MTSARDSLNILIAGSSGGIGQALVKQFSNRPGDHRLMTISRQARVGRLTGTSHLQLDLAASSGIPDLIGWFEQNGIPDQVYVCTGVLHDDQNGPEKSLEQLAGEWLQQSIRINVLTHVHLAQALNKAMPRGHALRWLSLSAMVGSIGDNRSGGWYSYRMSKAALNMFLKTLSIEWGRRFPNAIVAAVHPGTTVTPLSAPFTSGLAADRLYSAEQTAGRMTAVMAGLEAEDSGGFFHWDGTPLDW